ncbi:hypothetical protein GFC06_14475 [Citrobacter braakii]|jgi:hypothetical protein|uniref:tripartite tricarboxylate transporter TctB family protein n=1 Tax=Citrobacter TaxID=544 RepID=UPI001299852A|nr:MULTISPECIES: tripartite tricarboxylate transporter TctB family protein [Citrobacter]MDU2945869.1 tripartite tricarboxylate transporter TctB family protein [Citrobacter sp.]QGG14381.1 hypothetical protein GFC06_14475 [Citrobacter braakii]WFW24097.1 tripartite tricarboxylate transporter TctB family protein [Citrobacter braakii]
MVENPLTPTTPPPASTAERQCYILVALLLCLIAVVVLAIAKSFPATSISTDIGAGAFPSVYSWLLIILSLILIAGQFSGTTLRRLMVLPTRPTQGFGRWTGPFCTVVTCVAYLYAMQLFGYLVATVLFMILIMKISGIQRWWVNGLLAIVLSITLYILFSLALNVPLPESSLLESLTLE